ncbi:MAG: hypothetical protein HYY90_03210 [Candidatus Omnitrophica bacterium]|nr:hypothetical protein [Candidatus Omnitrophota bacterium]
MGEKMVKPSGSEEERGFQALLERIEGDVRTFGEQVTSLGEKIDKVADEFGHQLTALDGKVDLHTRRILSEMNKRSEGLTRELRALGSRLDIHEHTHLGR